MGNISKQADSKRAEDDFAEALEWAAKREQFRNDEYFALLQKIEENKSKGDYKTMLEYCEKSLPLLPQFVENLKQTDGEFSIGSIPAIELGCKFWAVLNDRSHIKAVKAIVDPVPELARGWGDEIDAAFEMERASCEIQAYVREHPGTVQSKLKSLIGTPPEMISEVAYWLSRLGKLKRLKAGRSYALYIE
jgi:hypothetical protein